MKWLKYFIAFICGTIFSAIFTLNLTAFIMQDNLEKIVKHHIYMLERFDKGAKPFSRTMLVANVKIFAHDLEKMIENEPFADCSDNTKSVLLNARKYSDTVTVCE